MVQMFVRADVSTRGTVVPYVPPTVLEVLLI